MTTSSVIPHFKDKIVVFGFQLHFIKKLTLGKNFCQCLEQNEIQPVCQKIQSSCSDSVATLEKKLEKNFPGFVLVLFKKPAKKVEL